ITSSSATIAWSTDEPADSQVEYGTTTAYGSSTSLDPTRVTSHSQTLSGLSPATTYHYRVKSKDAAGTVADTADFKFPSNPLPRPTPHLFPYPTPFRSPSPPRARRLPGAPTSRPILRFNMERRRRTAPGRAWIRLCGPRTRRPCRVFPQRRSITIG